MQNNNNLIKIRRLPSFLIDQIKAGEVIEGPSNLIKEVIENAIDAKAKKITLKLINNGLDLIQVSDNGIGMCSDALPLAFARHATSKICQFKDLYSLSSFGFRGEALASIASISKISCKSIPQEGTQSGGKIILEGGKEIQHFPIEKNQESSGTTIEVEDLFYNTPVRLKFLKSKVSEKQAIKKVIFGFLISRPDIEFNINWDNKTRENFPALPPGDHLNRIKQVVREVGPRRVEFLESKQDYLKNQVHGFFCSSWTKRIGPSCNFIFINGRLILDPKLNAIIAGLFKSQSNGDTKWNYWFFITVPSAEVDVNVHPKKTTITFEKPSLIYSLVSAVIKKVIPTHKINQETTQMELNPLTVKEELQGLSLLNKTETDTRFKSSNEQKDLEVVATISSFQLIKANKYSPKHVFSVSLNKLVGNYILRKYTHPLSDSDIIPLLISEPLTFSSHSFPENQENLKKYGFEIDKLSHNTYLLRSIPHFFKDLPYNQIIVGLLNYLEKYHKRPTNESFDTFFKYNLLIEDNVIDTQFTLKAIDFLGFDSLIKEKILIELNNEFFESIHGTQEKENHHHFGTYSMRQDCSRNSAVPVAESKLL